MKLSESDSVEGVEEGRRRSFSDSTPLQPNALKNKRGPQTSNSYPKGRQVDGIAHTLFSIHDRLPLYQSTGEELPRIPRGLGLPLHPRTQEEEVSGSKLSRRGGRRYGGDVGLQYSGLLSLKSCSHPVRHCEKDLEPVLESVAPAQRYEWYRGSMSNIITAKTNTNCNSNDMSSSSNNSSGRNDNNRIVNRDDTDHSHDSSRSSTPTPIYEDREFSYQEGPVPPPRITVSGVISDARAMLLSGAGAISTASALTTPDVSPLHSPYRFACYDMY